jgi:hypothetical protein
MEVAMIDVTVEVNPVARALLIRALHYFESSTRHIKEGWFLTGSNAATVSTELFESALRVAAEPTGIMLEVANAIARKKEAEGKYLWHDANCWATVAQEIRAEARLRGLDPTLPADELRIGGKVVHDHSG